MAPRLVLVVYPTSTRGTGSSYSTLREQYYTQITGKDLVLLYALKHIMFCDVTRQYHSSSQFNTLQYVCKFIIVTVTRAAHTSHSSSCELPTKYSYSYPKLIPNFFAVFALNQPVVL